MNAFIQILPTIGVSGDIETNSSKSQAERVHPADASPALCVESPNVNRKFSGVSERAFRVKHG